MWRILEVIRISYCHRRPSGRMSPAFLALNIGKPYAFFGEAFSREGAWCEVACVTDTHYSGTSLIAWGLFHPIHGELKIRSIQTAGLALRVGNAKEHVVIGPVNYALPAARVERDCGIQ
jgi:hypothetical protein